MKKMNGFVTFMLCLAMVANALRSVEDAVHMYNQYTGVMALRYGFNCLIAVVNLFGSFLLLRWNKTGFYLFVVSAFLATAYNIHMTETYSFMTFQPLCVLVILWVILQIKKEGKSAWSQLQTRYNDKESRYTFLIFGAVIVILFFMTIAAFNNAGTSMAPPDKDAIESGIQALTDN